MKVLVCGSRNWKRKESILKELEKLPKDTIIIHGAARGADLIAGDIAQHLGLTVKEFPADWDKYKKAAGIIRNKQMLEEKPNLILAFHENIESSKGTAHMIKIASEAGIEVRLFTN